MTIELAGLLALPELAHARLVCGDGRRPVAGVSIEVASGEEAGGVRGEHGDHGERGGPGGHGVRPGDLVAVVGSLPGGWRADALLRRLADRGASAVVLAQSSGLDDGNVALARRLQVAIIACQRPWEVAMAVRDVVVVGGRERVGALLARLAEALSDQTAPLDVQLGRAARIMGIALSVLDRDAHVASSMSGPVAASASEIVSAMRRGADRVERTAAGPVLLASIGGESGPWWLAGDVPLEAGWRSEALAAGIRFTARFAAESLARTQLARASDELGRTTALARLLEEPGAVAPQVARAAAEYGWALGGWNLAVRWMALDRAPSAMSREQLEAALSGISPPAHLVTQLQGWAGFISWPHRPRALEVASLVEALRAAHREMRAHLNVGCGVGRALAGVQGLRESMAQALSAIRLAAARPEAGHFAAVDQMSATQLLLAQAQAGSLSVDAARLLEPLLAADARLVTTLGAYLDHESSLTHTAAVLGVHRNTVADRIRRVETILRVTLADPHTRLALHLACRALPPERCAVGDNSL